MTLTVDYLPIANDGSANVESQAQYVIDLAGGGSLVNGFQAGLAKSNQMNKTWRQSSVMTAAIANFIANELGISVLDDGVVATLTTNLTSAIKATAALPRGYIAGLTLSNDGGSPNTVFDISAGVARSSDDTTNLIPTGAYTKTLGAWAVGTGNGSLDTGAAANNTAYHVFIIERLDTGVVDYLTSLSATAPTLPANYTKFRRIGSIRTAAASTNILPFVQLGNTVLLVTEIQDINTAAQGTTAIFYALSVPTGIKVDALLRMQFTATGGYSAIVSSPDESDQAGTGGEIATSTSGGSNVSQGAGLSRRTNTSGQIRIRSTSAATTVLGFTFGWVDYRGAFD